MLLAGREEEREAEREVANLPCHRVSVYLVSSGIVEKNFLTNYPGLSVADWLLP